MMRKTLLTLMLLSTVAAVAQKRVKGFTAPVYYYGYTMDLTGKLTYYEDGRLAGFSLGLGFMGQHEDVTGVGIEYPEGKIVHSLYVSQQEDPLEKSEATLTDGLAYGVSYTVGTDTYNFDLEYDDKGHLVSVYGKDEIASDAQEDLVWENGNVKKITVSKDGRQERLLTFDYTDYPSTPFVNGLISMLVESSLTDNNHFGFTPVKNFGLECANLPAQIASTDGSANSDDLSLFTFDYEHDANGYLTTVVMDGFDLELDDDFVINTLEMTLQWEDDPTAIAAPKTEKQTGERVYNMNGQRVDGRQRGLNIVQGIDGSIRKVLVK